MFKVAIQSNALTCVLLILGGAVFYLLVRRLFEKRPIQPDPWDAEVEAGIHSADAVPVCRHCFAPRIEHVHFCTECGTSVGDYNNLLPYIYIFSVGEGLRTGTSGNYKVTPITTAGYLFWSLVEYAMFAPVYWYFLFKNVKRISTDTKQEIEQSGSEASL